MDTESLRGVLQMLAVASPPPDVEGAHQHTLGWTGSTSMNSLKALRGDKKLRAKKKQERQNRKRGR